MKHVLGILLCFALLASSFAFAETADFRLSKNCTFKDIVIQIDDETFELPVAANLGMAYREDGILMDFGVDYDSETLFPFQVKITNDAFSMCIGNSSTAYVFEGEIFQDDTFNFPEWNQSLCNMIAAQNFETEETIERMRNVVEEALYSPSEATTYNGQSAQQATGEMDGTATCELLEKVVNAYSPEFADSYIAYLNQYIAVIDSISDAYCYVDDEESEAASPAESIADLLPMMGIEIVSCKYNIVYTDSGAGESDYTFTLHIPESELEYDIALNIVRDENGEAEFSGGCTYPGDGYTSECTYSGSAKANSFDLEFAIDSTNDIHQALKVNVVDNEDGSYTMNVKVSETEEGISAEVECEAVSFENADSTANYNITVDAEGHRFGIQFAIETVDAEIEDRITGANEKHIATEEDMNNAASMLGMRVMSLAGDVETLMNDTVFTELSDAFTQLWNDTTDDYTVQTETVTAEEMPFEIPEFTYVPEGYTLREENYSVIDGSASAYLKFESENTEDADEYSYDCIVVYIGKNDGGYKEYTLSEDGTLVEENAVHVTVGASYSYATFTRGDADYSIYFYNNLDADEVVKFINGIVWMK